MIRQYRAHRRLGGDNPLGVGIIAGGSIFYLQDDEYFSRFGGRPICRDPWIVEAFLNGTMGAARRSRGTDLWEDAYLSGRSDTALVRSLRNGRRAIVAVRVLIAHDDLRLSKEPTVYPSRPDVHFYRRFRQTMRAEVQARAA